MARSKKKKRQILFRLLALYRPYLLSAVAVLILMACVSAVDMATPRIVQKAIDNLHLKTGGLDVLLRLSGLFLVLQLFKPFVTYLKGMLQVRAAMRTQCDLRQKIYDKLMRLNFAYFDKSHVGATIARSTRDIEKIHNFLGYTVYNAVELGVIVTATLVMLFALHPIVSAVSGFFIAVTSWFLVRYTKALKPMWKDIHNKYDKVTNVLEENIAGIRVVRSFGREKAEINRFTGRINVFLRSFIKTLMYWIYKMDGIQTFFAVSIPCVVFLCSWLVMEDKLQIGVITASVMYIQTIFWRVRNLGQIIETTQAAIASGERVFGLLDDKREAPLPESSPETGTLEGDVVFHNVTFRYPGTKKKILDKVSLRMPAGKTTALVGPMGAGKTTLGHLLLRFYEPDSGRITIGGVSNAKIPLGLLRDRSAVVFQETFLFSLPVRENIAFRNPTVPQKKIAEAARKAQSADFIHKLRHGYKTLIGERGVNLSGGQKQRVSIARSLLNDPDLLVLDAPSANLDAITEHRLEPAFFPRAGRTTLLISQRIASIRKADHIIVMDKGQIAGRGTHQELLERCGLYRAMYRSQFL